MKGKEHKFQNIDQLQEHEKSEWDHYQDIGKIRNRLIQNDLISAPQIQSLSLSISRSPNEAISNSFLHEMTQREKLNAQSTKQIGSNTN